MSIHQLAADLGLSISTVSRALNGYTDVAPQTRERVAKRAAEIGYKPHAGARSLKSGKAHAIGVILPTDDHSGHFISGLYSNLLGGIAIEVDGAGYSLFATTHMTPSMESELQRYESLIRSRWVDAFVVVRTLIGDPRVQLLQERGIPFVTYGRSQLAQDHPWVDTDNEGAFFQSTQRLIDLGHRRIALLNGMEGYTFAVLRQTGFERAMQHNGLAVAPNWVLHGGLTEPTGYALALQVLAQETPPTALLCATDAMAIGAIAACRSKGLQVGRDVSIIGYGDSDASRYCDPPLTTVGHQVFENGRHIGQLLLELLSGQPPSRTHYLEPVVVVPRASDGPCLNP
jgi:LacI family transcriptional regulator